MSHLDFFPKVALLSTAVLLSACGGGGGGSSSGYDGSTTPVAITTENVDTVVASAADFATADSSEFTQGFDFIGTGVDTYAVKAFPKGVHGFLQDTFTSVRVRETTSDVVDCVNEGVGTMKFVANDVDPYGDSAGDSMKITFSNCEFGDTTSGGVFNGSVTMKFISIQGEPDLYLSNYAMVADYTISNLKIQMKEYGAYTGDYVFMDGNYRIDISAVSPITTVKLSSSSMLMEAEMDGVKHEMLMTNMVQTFTENSSTSQLTYSNDLTISSTDLGGQIVIDTVTPFVVNNLETSPSSGSMVITGANGGNVTLTAQPDGWVEVQYDLEEPLGEVELVETVYWSAL